MEAREGNFIGYKKMSKCEHWKGKKGNVILTSIPADEK